MAHILVSSQAEAVAIAGQLAAGADFATLARQHSIDGGSAVQGGELGCLDNQQFVTGFEQAAQTQPIGQVSAPVQTQFGFHLILVRDQPQTADLESLALGDVLGLARGAQVTLDPRYGTWDRRNGRVGPAGHVEPRRGRPRPVGLMPPRGRVVVVGLGPAGADLVLPAARAALEAAPARLARTARHPAVTQLRAEGLALPALDDRYDDAEDLEGAYRAIVETVVGAAAEHDEVAYAVPGSPAVAERTVALLHEAADAGEIELRVVAGLSFADLAWTRLGVDPLEDLARVVDGRALESAGLDLGGTLLVAQCDDPFVLGDAKLALLDHADPTTPVTVLRHLGLADETATTVPLGELDRVAPDHLTTLALTLPSPAPGLELARLLELARTLRRPGGCPWDAEQTHHSLTRYLLEEAYEVVEAVEALPAAAPGGTDADDPAYAALVDELGDLLYQVIFHVVLAEEIGAFGSATWSGASTTSSCAATRTSSARSTPRRSTT